MLKNDPQFSFHGCLLDNAGLPITSWQSTVTGQEEKENGRSMEYAVVMAARPEADLKGEDGFNQKAVESFERDLELVLPLMRQQRAERKIKMLNVEPVGLPKNTAHVLDAIRELVGFARYRVSTTAVPVPALKDGKDSKSPEVDLETSLTKALLVELGGGSTENEALRFGAWGEYCPVSLKDKGKLIKGDSKNFSAVFDGALYAFIGEEERKKFLANPPFYITRKGPQLPRKGYFVAVKIEGSGGLGQEIIKQHAEDLASDYGWHEYGTTSDMLKAWEEGKVNKDSTSGIIFVRDNLDLRKLKKAGIEIQVVANFQEHLEASSLGNGDAKDADLSRKAREMNSAANALAHTCRSIQYGCENIKYEKPPPDAPSALMAYKKRQHLLLKAIDPFYVRALYSRPGTADGVKYEGVQYCPVALAERGQLVPATVQAAGAKCESEGSKEMLEKNQGKYDLHSNLDAGMDSNLEPPRVYVRGAPGTGRDEVVVGMKREFETLGVKEVEVKSLSSALGAHLVPLLAQDIIPKLQLQENSEKKLEEKKKHESEHEDYDFDEDEEGEEKKEKIGDILQKLTDIVNPGDEKVPALTYEMLNTIESACKMLDGAEKKENPQYSENTENSSAEIDEKHEDVKEGEDEGEDKDAGEEKEKGQEEEEEAQKPIPAKPTGFSKLLAKAGEEFRNDIGNCQGACITVQDVHDKRIVAALKGPLLLGREKGIPHLMVRTQCDENEALARYRRANEKSTLYRLERDILDFKDRRAAAWKDVRAEKMRIFLIQQSDFPQDGEEEEDEEVTAEKLIEIFQKQNIEVAEDTAAELISVLYPSKDDEKDDDDSEAKKISPVLLRKQRLAKEERLMADLQAKFREKRLKSLRDVVDSTLKRAFEGEKEIQLELKDIFSIFPNNPTIDGSCSDSKLVSEGAEIVRKLLRVRRYGFSKPVKLEPADALALLRSGLRALPARLGARCPVATLEGPSAILPSRPGTPRKEVASIGSYPVSWRKWIVFCGSELARERFMDNIERYLIPILRADPSLNTSTMKRIIEPGASIGSRFKNLAVEASVGGAVPFGLSIPHKCCVLGGPLSGRARVASELSDAMGLELLTVDSMLDAVANRACGRPFYGLQDKARNTLAASRAGPGILPIGSGAKYLSFGDMIQIVKYFTTLPKSQTRGWVLEGFPRTVAEAARMHKAGVTPFQVFDICVDQDDLHKRIVDKFGHDIDAKIRATRRLEDYFDSHALVQSHFRKTYDNLYKLNGKLSIWALSRKVIALALENAALRQAFHIAWAAGRPARLFGMAVTREQIMSRMNKKYGFYCPVSWYEEKALRPRATDTRFMSLYKDSVYCLADEKALEKFEKNPDIYINGDPLPESLPQRLSPAYSNLVKGEHCALWGYDPVEATKFEQQGLIDPPLVEGDPLYCVEFKGKVYRFKNEANLLEFMTFPTKYDNAKLDRKPDQRSMEECIFLGDFVGYMHKAVADILVDGLTAIADVRPIYPKTTASNSALLYLALYLKANNPNSEHGERQSAEKNFERYVQACNLARRLGALWRMTAAGKIEEGADDQKMLTMEFDKHAKYSTSSSGSGNLAM